MNAFLVKLTTPNKTFFIAKLLLESIDLLFNS